MSERPNIQDIRRFVDGELPPDELDRFESQLEWDPDLRRQVSFEKQLRNHISTVMEHQTPAPPSELADRIRGALAEADSVRDEPIAGRIGGDSRRNILSGPSKANFFAVAASLTIVAGAILFGIFGPKIDDTDTLPGLEDSVHEAAAFVSREHVTCAANEDLLSRKLIHTNPERTGPVLAQYLGVSHVPSFDLSPLGYSFVGGGQCKVPISDRSAHIMFRRENPAGVPSPMVSIFMVPDLGQFDFSSPFGPDQNTWIECQGGPDCVRRVLRTTNGEVVFFICCCMDDELDQVAQFLLQQLSSAP